MNPLMNQDLTRNIQQDFQDVAAQHRQAPAKPSVSPPNDALAVRQHAGEALSSRMGQLRLIRLQWPIRFSEG